MSDAVICNALIRLWSNNDTYTIVLIVIIKARNMGSIDFS